MAITDRLSGTTDHEAADGIYRIDTPVNVRGGGFSFNRREWRRQQVKGRNDEKRMETNAN